MGMKKRLDQGKKKTSVWQRILLVLSIVVLVLSIGACATVIFQKTYFTPFWINGQSMYPTLNKDAKYSDGSLIGPVRARGEQEGIYDVDYGFMDTHESSLNNIRRFNIIICKYDSKQVSQNIKRVIVLPGETFYIVNSQDKSINGNLYIKNKLTNKFELIEQPIDKSIISSGAYNSKYAVETTLANDEYFVMGDNRPGTNSYDSRSVGPIKRNLIYGIAVGINGKAKIGYNSEKVYGPISVAHHWPRFL